jgi:hypothetical protein
MSYGLPFDCLLFTPHCLLFRPMSHIAISYELFFNRLLFTPHCLLRYALSVWCLMSEV